jgi:hypothetical protein
MIDRDFLKAECLEILAMVIDADANKTNNYSFTYTNGMCNFYHTKLYEIGFFKSISSYTWENMDYTGADGTSTPFNKLKETIKDYLQLMENVS